MYLVGLQIYCKMIHGPYNIRCEQISFLLSFFQNFRFNVYLFLYFSHACRLWPILFSFFFISDTLPLIAKYNVIQLVASVAQIKHFIISLSYIVRIIHDEVQKSWFFYVFLKFSFYVEILSSLILYHTLHRRPRFFGYVGVQLRRQLSLFYRKNGLI